MIPAASIFTMKRIVFQSVAVVLTGHKPIIPTLMILRLPRDIFVVQPSYHRYQRTFML